MKHNWKKSTLTFLLTLLMLTGLFSALGGSAWADGENPYSSLVGTTTTVSFNNIDWYVIKYESSAVNEGTVTLLAMKPIGSSTFHDGGTSQASKFKDYNISTVKEYLDRQTAEGGGFARVAYAIAPTDLDDVSVTGAKLYLLSDTEADALNQNIKKTTIASGAEKNYWWLRTPKSTDYCYPAAAKMVNDYGNVGNPSNVGWRLGVRPALRLDLSKVTYDTTRRRFVVAPLEYSVTLSGGANATADPATGTSQTGLTGAMTTVTYTANSGYMFPETSDYYTTTSGVTVARTSNTKVTVSGTPTANVTITVPDAVVDETGAPVPYLAWDYTNKTMVEKTGDEACKDYTEVTDSTTTWGEPNGVTWYVVKKNVTISSRITVNGNVSLILCNGAKLTASRGITVADGGNILNIYAQSTDEATMGELIATGRPHNSYSGTEFADAGIGGTEGSAGIITINGGKITATGGYYYVAQGGAGIGGGRKGDGGTITINGGIINANGMEGGAGIGGGARDNDTGGEGGIITINGGVVVAKAIGSSNPRGAGIGGGIGGSGGTITINGGRVTAASGTWGAGIGGGANGNGGQITINDGTVEATGGAGGAGIGGGSNSSGGNITIKGGTVTAHGTNSGASSNNKRSGAGIGGGKEGTGGTITISGGTVTATAEADGAGIGGGASGSGGTVNISGGTVTATGGEAAAGIGGGKTAAGANVTITGGSVKALSGGTSVQGIPPAVAIGRGMKSWGEQDLPDNQLKIGEGLYVYGGETEATKAYIVPDVQGDYTRTQYMEVNDTVPPGYTITVDSSVTHGSVTPSATIAPEGTAIALTVAPATGYGLTQITAVWGDSQTALTLTKDSANENKYTFTMPAGDVTVNAKFSEPTITGADLALNGSLDFRFYVDIPAGIDTTGANMSFSIGGRSGRTSQNIPLTSAGISTDNTATKGQRIFSFPVYAIEMAEDVTAVFHYKAGGEDKTATLTTSIKKYLDKVEGLNKDPYSEKLAKLITATRNYGHYMQPYLADLHGFTIGTDYTAMPAGSEITALESLTGFERTWNTSDSLPTGYDNSVLNAVGYYDTFSESTTLNVLVNLKTSPSSVTATVDGKEATVENPDDNIYRIQISNIAANNLGTPYRVVFSADGTPFCDMNVSALTYVGTVLPKAAERNKTGEAEALTAFYDYYVAANAYAGN